MYGEYELIRARLVQALAYARLGDIHAVAGHLPTTASDQVRNRPGWLSGGDGMVRQLLVGVEIERIREVLLNALFQQNRVTEALAYIADIPDRQLQSRLLYYLGRQFRQKVRLAEATPLPSDDPARTEFMLGAVSALLDAGDKKIARELYGRLETTPRRQALDRLVRLFSIAGNWDSLTRLLSLAVQEHDGTTEMIRFAVELAVRAGDPGTASVLAELAGNQADDGLYAQIALGHIQREEIRAARRIFNGVSRHDDRAWEHVAVFIDQDDWLENHYMSIPDPWRRSERLVQFAMRRLESGQEEYAGHLAQLSLAAAADIASPPTAALAYQLLAEYFALAMRPVEVQRMIDAIGESPELAPYRWQTLSQLARAYARTGDARRAESAADQIGEVASRAAALAMAASEFHDKDHAAYSNLVDAARRVCEQGRNAGNVDMAWLAVAKMQIRNGDFDGAGATASAAPTSSAPAIHEEMVNAYIGLGEPEKAFAAADSMPEDGDPRTGDSRRQHAMSEAVAAIAAQGHGAEAYEKLSAIEHGEIRQLTTPPVARALVAEGNVRQAVALVKSLRREDSRSDALAVIFHALAERKELPGPELTSLLTGRQDGGLCWALAVSASIGSSQMNDWLGQIEPPRCRAFAHAGAAFAAVASPAEKAPSVVFAFVDPLKMTERLAEAMQIQAVFQP